MALVRDGDASGVMIGLIHAVGRPRAQNQVAFRDNLAPLIEAEAVALPYKATYIHSSHSDTVA